jgi:UDP:flavonoid glycosyltransferase YjiC (YdhE family)
MITLGTFLSNRVDVIERLIRGCQAFDPDAQLFVSAGHHESDLKHLGGKRDVIEHFLPQRALMPYMDMVIHHGGNNTFTEALYHEVPMIILPFSSDQFNVSYDVTREHLGLVLDPNHFDQDQLVKALSRLQHTANLQKYARISKERGPDYATSELLKVI